MIPKRIIYIWIPLDSEYGRKKDGTYTENFYRESWEYYAKDYEIVNGAELFFADERNKDNQWVNYCMSIQAYALVADYMRIWCLYNYGGVYLDVDILLTDYLDKITETSNCFFRMEEFANNGIDTGIMACVKGFAPFKHILEKYNEDAKTLESSGITDSYYGKYMNPQYVYESFIDNQILRINYDKSSYNENTNELFIIARNVTGSLWDAYEKGIFYLTDEEKNYVYYYQHIEKKKHHILIKTIPELQHIFDDKCIAIHCFVSTWCFW